MEESPHHRHHCTDTRPHWALHSPHSQHHQHTGAAGLQSAILEVGCKLDVCQSRVRPDLLARPSHQLILGEAGPYSSAVHSSGCHAGTASLTVLSAVPLQHLQTPPTPLPHINISNSMSPLSLRPMSCYVRGEIRLD